MQLLFQYAQQLKRGKNTKSISWKLDAKKTPIISRGNFCSF